MAHVEQAGGGPAPGFARHPNHSVRLEPGRSVIVRFAGAVIARTTRAIALEESGYRLRHYIPRQDIAADALVALDHRSYCPFKGEARYWTVAANGKSAEKAAWAYDAPYDECAALAGHVAFYDEAMDSVETG